MCLVREDRKLNSYVDNLMNIFRDIRSTISKVHLHSSRECSAFRASKLINMEGLKVMQDMGYIFNSNGQLRRIGANGKPTDEPFQFIISGDHQQCQAHYEELGAAVTYYIYQLLETELKLQKLLIPKNCVDGTFIFVSKDYDKKDVLMVLIHGSGVVRAGQWARSLIINDSLEVGSQIPYIKKALAKGYGVMVLNTNDNYTMDGVPIPESSNAEEHALCAWRTYISQTMAHSIAIVAHSYGGVVTAMLAEEMKDDFETRVKALALTDSVHTYSNKTITPCMKQIARNWISSQKPLDTPMKTPDFEITRVSAGVERHERTSHSCIESVFKFIEQKLHE